MKKVALTLSTCALGIGLLVGCQDNTSEKDHVDAKPIQKETKAAVNESNEKVKGEGSESKSNSSESSKGEEKVRKILNELYTDSKNQIYIGTKIVSIEKKDDKTFYVETDNGELQVDVIGDEWNIYERNTGAKYFSSNGNDVRTTNDSLVQDDTNKENDNETGYSDEIESLAKEILNEKIAEYPEVLGTEIKTFERRDRLIFYVVTDKEELSLQLKESTDKENTMDWSIAKFGSPEDLFHSEGWDSF